MFDALRRHHINLAQPRLGAEVVHATDDFFAEFRSRRGYDLRERLPALCGDGDPDTVARVKHDYRETISDLHVAYVRRWTEWCHACGERSRNQAHGGPTNLLDAYAAADIPETEVYRTATERQMPMLKLAASAAHTSGRNLVSAEAFTVGSEKNSSIGRTVERQRQVPAGSLTPENEFPIFSQRRKHGPIRTECQISNGVRVNEGKRSGMTQVQIPDGDRSRVAGNRDVPPVG